MKRISKQNESNKSAAKKKDKGQKKPSGVKKGSKKEQSKTKGIYKLPVGALKKNSTEIYKAIATDTTEKVVYFHGDKIMEGKCDQAVLWKYTNSRIRSVAFCHPFMFVGVSSSQEKLNIFDFISGTGSILVLNCNLMIVDQITVENGEAVSMDFWEKDRKCEGIVLFSSGELMKLTYDLPSKGHFKGAAKWECLERELKVIRFSVCGNALAYTDGFRVVFKEGDIRRVSQNAQALIVDIALVCKEGCWRIFVIERNGRHISCDSEFNDLRDEASILATYRFFNFKEYGVLMSTDGIHVKKFEIFPETEWEARRGCLMYTHRLDGGIEVHRLMNKHNSMRQILQMVEKNQTLFVCDHPEEFKEFKGNECCIVDVFASNKMLFLATESGVVLRICLE